jgi:hypothetical protein
MMPVVTPVLQVRLLGDFSLVSDARTYQTCVTILERELAVGPSSATRRVYEQYIQAEESWTPLSVPELAQFYRHTLHTRTDHYSLR